MSANCSPTRSCIRDEYRVRVIEDSSWLGKAGKMADIDYSGKTLTQLDEIIAGAEAAKKAALGKEVAAFKAETEQKAEQLGIDLAEMFGGSKGGKAKAVGVPKYRNPDNPDQTWTGKGRAPGWAQPYKDRDALADIAI